MKIQGNKLKEAREYAGLSREQLADIAGLTRARIWQIETDEVCNLNDNIVAAICKKMKIHRSEIEA